MKINWILLLYFFFPINTRNILTKIDSTFAKAIIFSGVFVMIYQTEINNPQPKKQMAIFDKQSLGFVYDNTKVYENRYIN